MVCLVGTHVPNIIIYNDIFKYLKSHLSILILKKSMSKKNEKINWKEKKKFIFSGPFFVLWVAHIYRTQKKAEPNHLFCFQHLPLTGLRLDKRFACTLHLHYLTLLYYLHTVFFFWKRKWESAFQSTLAKPVFKSAMPAGNSIALNMASRSLLFLFLSYPFFVF